MVARSLYTVGMRVAFLVAGLLLATGFCPAEVVPNSLFSDGAVLQQGMPVPVWGTADDGERVTVTLQQQTVSTVAKNRRWTLQLKALRPGGPFEMTIRGQNTVVIRNILVGEVWACSGQSNMELPVSACDRAKEELAASANPMIHLLRIRRLGTDQPEQDAGATWKNSGPDSAANFSGVCYFFGRDLQKALHVPVGLIDASWGGTPAEAWMSRKALQSRPEFQIILDEEEQHKRESPQAMAKYESDLAQWNREADAARREGREFTSAKPRMPPGPFNFRRPVALYNGMIQPLVPYALRGVTWYQGESNSPRAWQYRTLFPALIADWRSLWQRSDLPFLFVQLAPYKAIVDEPSESLWAELRESQFLTSRTVPGTAMAVITDVGDEENIHPVRKQPVGARLALAARALAYGEHIEYSGPSYRSYSVDGDRIVLQFDHIGQGLVSHDGPLQGFTICGADRKFQKAHAAIRGDTVVVWNETITKPIAVRYGWSDYPVVNLWNQDGLPASPFRTDDFRGLSWPAEPSSATHAVSP